MRIIMFSGIQPFYQEADGYKDCFSKQKSADENSLIDTASHCLPSKRPEDCSEEAWNDLSMLKKNEDLEIEPCPEIKGKYNDSSYSK